MSKAVASTQISIAAQAGTPGPISDLVIESLDEFAAPAYTCSTNADYISGAVLPAAYN